MKRLTTRLRESASIKQQLAANGFPEDMEEMAPIMMALSKYVVEGISSRTVVDSPAAARRITLFIDQDCSVLIKAMTPEQTPPGSA